MTDSKTYKITFINQGEIYELYAKQVYQPDLYGFVVIEEIVFGEKTNLVVDPSEERLKSEFEAVLKVNPEDVQKKMDKALGRSQVLDNTE